MKTFASAFFTSFYSLFFILALSSEALSEEMKAGKQSKSHAGPKSSLLAECLASNAMPSIHCGRTPSFAIDADGKAYSVFSQNGHLYLTITDDFGKSYSAPVAINRRPEAIYDDGENRPKILLSGNNALFVSWTHKTPGRYSGDVRFARSLDAGKSFSEPVTINTDTQLISHRFDTMALDGSGRLYLFWIDKRDQHAAAKSQHDYLGAALYYTYSDDQGASFQPDMKWVDHSCECCRIATAKNVQGKIALLWRHVFPGNIRDHAIAYIDGKQNQISGQPLKATIDNWHLEGCPHHGPDMSFDANHRAHMVWFTQGEKHQGLVYGQYDFKTQNVHAVKAIDTRPAASRPQVEVIGDHVYIIWKRFNGQAVDLLLLHSIDLGKTWSEEEVIANTSHDSDHPDFIRQGETLFASWHTQAEGLKWIKVKP